MRLINRVLTGTQKSKEEHMPSRQKVRRRKVKAPLWRRFEHDRMLEVDKKRKRSWEFVYRQCPQDL